MPLQRSLHLGIILLTVFALLCGGASPAQAQAQPAGPSDPAEVAAFMDGLLLSQMAEQHVSGAVVVIVKDGKVLFSKGYGYADRAARTPVDPAKTLFRPGSVSKLFVWTAVMQLVEQGQLDLSADVNRYLDFTIPATYAQPVTLETLLTHTPGFEDKGEDLFKLKPEQVISLEAYLKKNLPARVFLPGTVGAYSNYGTALAGYIIERVSGLSFAEYVEKNIFAPLGMAQATFRQPLPPQLAADMAGGYNYVQGEYLQGGFEYVVAYPAGSLSAAGLDMAKFMIAHLQNGRYGEARILKEETARRMRTRLYSADARLDGMAYGFFENVLNGQRVLSHGGDTILFHSGLYLLPEQNLGLFISTNTTGGAALGAAVAQAFMAHYFPQEAPAAPVPTADFETRAARYAGEYFFARSNFSGFEKFFSLFSRATVSIDMEKRQVLLMLGSEVSRFVEVEPGLLVSVTDPNNRMVLKEENGQVMLAPSSPFVLIQAPWQAVSALHMLILGGGAVLFLFALLGWFKALLGGLFKRQPRSFSAGFARLTASLFGLSYLVFVGMLVGLMLNADPAYGQPSLFFETPAWFGTFLLLPLACAACAALMLPSTVLVWVKGCWSLSSRLFYTLLTLAAAAVLWSLNFWNLLF